MTTENNTRITENFYDIFERCEPSQLHQKLTKIKTFIEAYGEDKDLIGALSF